MAEQEKTDKVEAPAGAAAPAAATKAAPAKKKLRRVISRGVV